MAASEALTAYRKAYKEVRKKIRTLPDRKLNSNLEFCCGSLADAYNQGVAEAQGELLHRIDRLVVLQQSADGKPSPRQPAQHEKSEA